MAAAYRPFCCDMWRFDKLLPERPNPLSDQVEAKVRDVRPASTRAEVLAIIETFLTRDQYRLTLRSCKTVAKIHFINEVPNPQTLWWKISLEKRAVARRGDDPLPRPTHFAVFVFRPHGPIVYDYYTFCPSELTAARCGITDDHPYIPRPGCANIDCRIIENHMFNQGDLWGEDDD